ncbi:hypothetical protein EVA_10285 [gut metagenome]|uniref:Uncharacterized protein n=1 Tax=gut metagenome TaxID=749906 RepID=J9GI61_9ZZZZ
MSLESPKCSIVEHPSASPLQIKARWLSDLEEGIWSVPARERVGSKRS